MILIWDWLEEFRVFWKLYTGTTVQLFHIILVCFIFVLFLWQTQSIDIFLVFFHLLSSLPLANVARKNLFKRARLSRNFKIIGYIFISFSTLYACVLVLVFMAILLHGRLPGMPPIGRQRKRQRISQTKDCIGTQALWVKIASKWRWTKGL